MTIKLLEVDKDKDVIDTNNKLKISEEDAAT